jgi:hypothetical protein
MLEEFCPFYPDFNENDSQLVFNGLAEIHALEAKKGVEKRVSQGDFYKHQKIEARMMQMNDRLLTMSDPGTGKTGGFIATDELFKSSTNLFKKYYYVTPSSLEESTRNQIICKLTNNKYINDQGHNKATVSEVRYSNKESFNKNYTMVTYDELHKSIKGKYKFQLEEIIVYLILMK